MSGRAKKRFKSVENEHFGINMGYINTVNLADMPPKNMGELWTMILERYGLSVLTLGVVGYLFFTMYQQDNAALKDELRTQVQILQTRIERLEREKEFLLHENAQLKAEVEAQRREITRLKRYER